MEKFPPSLLLRSALAALLLSSLPLAASAQAARFDLTGPKIDARVTRDGKTLPIAYVPNLQPGDKLWLHPELPPTQSVHLLLIVAFLRGSTNPPPDEWFTKIETWNRKTDEGVTVTVPDEAQQAILFLAPETGGDFTTLKKAVRGRPGIFVRASQDLSEAGFEQARIEKYIASISKVPPSDPKALLDHSNLLARTLNLKPNDDCFKRPVDMQYNCLTQSGNQTLLDDGHAQSVVSVLSNGSSSDFITAASYTSLGGGGTYSAYVGAIVDLFRILGALHTAQYQYIPAISFPEEESLNLRLNAAPSFRNPKSVIVIGLPSVQKSVLPPLRPTDPKSIACLLKPKVVLPIEGAPLVFSTSFAHNLVLHLNIPPGSPPIDGEQSITRDIPLIPDAYQGGLIVDHAPEHRALPKPSEAEFANPTADPAQSDPKTPAADSTAPNPLGEITGTITGSWGFDTFIGPTLHLQDIPGANWKLAADDPLIAGRENHILLSSTGTACVASITAETNPGTFAPAVWKPANLPDLIDVNLPLKSHDPGALHISIQQFGESIPATVTAKTFIEPATLTALEFHAGDTSITATGTHLSQVRQLSVNNLTFTPAPAPEPTVANEPAANPTTLRLTLADSTPTPKFKTGETLNATVILNDGRNIILPVTVALARPNLTLLSRNMGHPTDPALRLGSDDDLPISQQLTFSLKSPTPFPRAAKIEIANADESLRTELTVAAGTLVLQNPHTILGTLDPLKTFGTSAFGPLRLRAVSPEGISGDWIPLITLVRLPTLDSITCPADPSTLCTLSGAKLYLLEAISTNPGFTTPITIPDGFVASTIAIPHPADLPATRSKSRIITLYLRLRDDPTSTTTATIQILPIPAPAPPAATPATSTQPEPAPTATPSTPAASSPTPAAFAPAPAAAPSAP